MIATIITMTIISIISFAIGFAVGYVAHICKTMPTKYIAQDENPNPKRPFATYKGAAIFVGDKRVATVKDEATAQALVEEMNGLPQ